ncbi:MAG TPA: hypothetical protein VG125_11230 [Pirellulales bacterium]|jgi:Fe-S-cluster containining protein|nr:hypothetical protein [Pirellulales bacterium]
MEIDRPATLDPLVAAAQENGLPAHEVDAIAKRVGGRSCGDCTACCTVKGVSELGKPSQTACRHLCPTGCAIYSARPKGCRDYACLWRQGWIEGDERRRPDKLGVLFDYDLFERIPGSVRLVVWEVVPGAAQSQKVRFIVGKLLETHPQIRAVAYCAAGKPAHHNYPIDRQTYPGGDAPMTPPVVSFDAVRRVITYEFRNAG